MDEAAAAFYDAWKARYLHEGCERGQAYVFYNRDKTAGAKDAISVSEGHGYGMLATVLYAGHDPQAQNAFDALAAYFKAHPSHFTKHLMSWQQFSGCVDKAGDNDSATDGDLDIACAFLMADKQWGSAGAVNYRAEALEIIADIKAAEVNPLIPSLKPGDWARDGMSEESDMRISDFMPAHLRAFAAVTHDLLWDKLLAGGYSLLAQIQQEHSPQTGLLPDFVQHLNSGTPAPAKRKYMESAYDGQYYYNACRVPFRVGIDYLLNGEPRAKKILDKLNAFIRTASYGDPAQIKAGYYLNGKVIHEDDTSLAFLAPFGVSAMCQTDQQWLDALWTDIVSTPLQDDDYFGNTLKMLCLTAMSGNWWSVTGN